MVFGATGFEPRKHCFRNRYATCSHSLSKITETFIALHYIAKIGATGFDPRSTASEQQRSKLCNTSERFSELNFKQVSYLTTVGATGFEPATSSSRTMRATELRYAPI